MSTSMSGGGSAKRPGPAQVREQVLSQHRGLRRLLGQAMAVTEDKVAQIAQELRRNFLYHLTFEETFMFPALRDADIWGPQRLDAVTAEHRQQRAELDGLIDLLRDGRPAAEIAQAVKALAEKLEKDMEAEEAELLNPNLLRDDVVAIDQSTD